MGVKGFLVGILNQKRITISLMTMETATKSGKNQKFSRKMREEMSEPFKT